MGEKIQSYKDLIVWQKSINLVVEIYKLTNFFPREELYGLTNQMRRSSVSIPSNIAEGRGRGTAKDFIQFLRIALGSTNELETQIIIAKKLFPNINYNYSDIDGLILEITKMLKTMINKLNPN
ncbi:MAG: four helix bundle protein [Patescibacteria group bacterium]|nr:four helix bundle protein [Patescibacteria group bacterium]MDD4610754.1 four helix bundle protein [Patescibacteria group bacterium]